MSRYSYYGGVGSWNTKTGCASTNPVQDELRNIAVSPPKITPANTAGKRLYYPQCGHNKMDLRQGFLTEKGATRYAQFDYPQLQYKLQGGYESDMKMLRNWDETPAGSTETGKYTFCQESAQKPWVSSAYVHASPNESLTLTETQMVNPPINSMFGYNKVSDPEMGFCGGQWVVDPQTRQVQKKSYYVGYSQGYPSKEAAEYAAENLVLPSKMVLVESL